MLNCISSHTARCFHGVFLGTVVAYGLEDIQVLATEGNYSSELDFRANKDNAHFETNPLSFYEY